ncbi:MAG: tRNA (guanosine(37)-N1)-methyltransferase TrmD [Clostridia bacterium]|nr:tRNA (guanosine(37)-N1)-methyltransferase TrmD [Clostridia bacterium]
MRFDIMTLFPELVSGVLGESIMGRAQKAGHISVHAHNIRDYANNKHRKVDDTVYGGGFGMLMMAPPVCDCYDAVREQAISELGEDAKIKTVYMSPQGKVLAQQKAQELSEYDGLIIICGHYEGIDTRALEEIQPEEISIGDYVLTGGELPACILVDCISRLKDGVLSDKACYEEESISSGLLEYPQYTRPYEFRGKKVPDVLISGNHAEIDKWRREQARIVTEKKRPDLLE